MKGEREAVNGEITGTRNLFYSQRSITWKNYSALLVTNRKERNKGYSRFSGERGRDDEGDRNLGGATASKKKPSTCRGGRG